MAKAKKLPSGNWRVNLFVGFDDNHKRKYKSFTSPSKKEAEHAALEYQLTMKSKRNPMNLTVGEAIDKYISLKAPILSPATISGYKKIRKNNFQELMNISLVKLTQEHIQSAVNSDASRLSSKTIRNAHGLLSAVLREYYPDFILRTSLPRPQRKIHNIPSDKDIRLILKAIKGTDIEIPVLLAVWLSLRMSEVRGLKWENVYEDRIVINEAIVDAENFPVVKGTKSYAGTRVIALPRYLKDVLMEKPREGDYVTNLSGQAIYKRFIRLQEKIGVGPYRFHDLRHANASIMLKLGIPDKYAMERGGWSTNSTLKAVYQHTMVNEKEQINAKIDNYFEELMQHEMQHDS